METKTVASPKLPWFPWIGKRPFYGWAVVAAGALTQFTQGIAGQGFSTYLVPLQQQFGWSRAILAGPRSIATMESAVLGPIEGYLVDRVGPRLLVAVGTFVMGLGLILFGLTNSLWMYYLSNIIIALGTGFQGLLVVSVAVNQWFRRKRSMAVAVMLLGFSMAGVVGVPALVLIQTTLGWQTSAILNGLLVWAVGLPCSLLFTRSPEHYGMVPDGDTVGATVSVGAKGRPVVEEYDFTLRQALHTRTFWLLAFGLAMGNLGTAASMTHLFLHLEQGIGLSRTTAALVWTVVSITTIPARLIGGFIGDRLPKNIVLGAGIVLVALSQFILGVATSFPMALTYALIYGLGWGARAPVMISIQGEYFGRKSQGIIRGWLATVSVPITMAAPVVIGYIADVQGTYRLAFIGIAFLVLIGAALLFLATPPKPPSRTKMTI